MRTTEHTRARSAYKGQYTKVVKKTKRNQSKLAGTQALDQRWRWLKEYLPFNLHGRRDREVNPTIHTYVFSWQWRSNVMSTTGDIWSALGDVLRTKTQ